MAIVEAAGQASPDDAAASPPPSQPAASGGPSSASGSAEPHASAAPSGPAHELAAEQQVALSSQPAPLVDTMKSTTPAPQPVPNNGVAQRWQELQQSAAVARPPLPPSEAAAAQPAAAPQMALAQLAGPPFSAAPQQLPSARAPSLSDWHQAPAACAPPTAGKAAGGAPAMASGGPTGGLGAGLAALRLLSQPLPAQLEASMAEPELLLASAVMELAKVERRLRRQREALWLALQRQAPGQALPPAPAAACLQAVPQTQQQQQAALGSQQGLKRPPAWMEDAEDAE